MKKIKLLATFVLMIITITTFTLISRATTGIVNDDTIKIRREPNETSTVLDLLYEGDKVEILEEKDGWYKVKATTSIGKITGYINKELIDVEKKDNETTEKTPVEKQETTPVVTPKIEKIEEDKEYTIVQEVGIKIVPLITSRENAKITGNIKVVEILNNWARVENETNMGWVRVNTLKKSLAVVENPIQENPTDEKTSETTTEEPISNETVEKEPEKPEEPQTIELNKTGYVKTEGLRVRKGPSTDTDEITSLSKNDEVKIIGQTGNWYKIELKGKIGYVSAKYISDTKIAETTSRDGSTLKNETTTETKKEEAPKVETTPEPEVPATSGTKGNEIVEFAKKYLGYKYVSGGTSPSKGFDCSGFTQYVYKQFGITVNRSSKDQIKNGVAVDFNNLQPGDLVIFNDEANKKIGHVGIYVGDGNFIHASNPKDGVKITTLLSGYYKIRYVGARRVF